MSEISNAFEHFIMLLMKSESHFLNKSESNYMYPVNHSTSSERDDDVPR